MNWADIYKQQSPRLLGLCMRYVRDRQKAEDLMHDAFLTAIHKSEQFTGSGTLEGWLRQITLNTVLMCLRQEKKLLFTDTEELADTPEIFENQSDSDPRELILAHGFSQGDLLNVLHMIPQHHQVVFNLYVFESWTHKEIAASLGISAGTSKSHLARARKKIQEILLTKAKDMEKKKKRAAIFILPSGEDDTAFIDRFYQKSLGNISVEPSAIPDAVARALSKTKPALIKPRIRWLAITTGCGMALLLTLFLFNRNSSTDTAPESVTSTLPVPTTEISGIVPDSQPVIKTTARTEPASLPVKNNPPTKVDKVSAPPPPVIVNKKVIQKDTVYQFIDDHEK